MAFNYSVREEALFSPLYHWIKFDDNETVWQSSSLLGLSRHGEITLRFVVYGVITGSLAVFGIVGNLLSILVLTRKSMRSPISCLLCGLAVSDLTACCLMIPFLCVANARIFVHEVNGWEGNYLSSLSVTWLMPLYIGLAMTCITSSIYFTVAVTIERYIAICHPFKANAIFNYRRARLTAVGIIVFAIVYNLPRWWEFELMEIHDPVTEAVSGYRPIPSSLRRDEAYELYYHDLSLLLFVICIPLVTMCALNVQIYVTVSRANRDRKNLSSSQKQENSVARMLLIIVTFSIVAYAFAIVEVLGRKFISACNGTCLELQVVRDIFVLLNYSVNFFVYFIKSSKFQATLIAMWPSCFERSLRKLPLPPAWQYFNLRPYGFCKQIYILAGERSASVVSSTSTVSIFVTRESQRASHGPQPRPPTFEITPHSSN